MDWIKRKEWDLSKVGENLVDLGSSIIESDFFRYNSVEEQIARLLSTVRSINALLMDAEGRLEIKDVAVKTWLRELKALAFDADDLLDYHRTALAVYRQKRESNQLEEGLSRKRKRLLMELLLPFPLPSFSPEWGLFHRRRIAVEIERTEKRFDFILTKRRTLRLVKDDSLKRLKLPNRTIGFFPQVLHDPAPIVGRVTELNAIVEVLTADLREVSGSTQTLPMVAIQGAPGIGKTTLARMVYHDRKVDSYFNLKVWVDSTDWSGVSGFSELIHGKITKQRSHLKHLVKKRYLIVIDSLWDEDFQCWETLGIPLIAAQSGSRVLITTRNESICRLMSPMLHLTNLTGLGKEHCWDLFCSLALPRGVEGRDDEQIQVATEIANKCNGSPLAAKCLGALLNGMGDEEWQLVLDELHLLEHNRNRTLPSLLVSYHHLPYPIKRCFAYCSIFPKGYLFGKDQLIRYWLAEGLIPYEVKRRSEHTGTKFFDELLWRSFFEKYPTDDKSKRERLNDRGDSEKYRLSSLMHDLARSISEHEFVDLGNDISITKSAAGHVRYASLLQQDRKPIPIESACKFMKLRTLIFCGESKGPLMKVPTELFTSLTRLRVFDVSCSALTEIPDTAFDQLVHLRYLSLSHTKIKELPVSVCKLYNLQTLELRGCMNLAQLPKRLSNLVNLRHLGLHVNWENISDKHSLCMPHGFDNLRFLQTLSRFTVASNSDVNSNICELKNLDLRGDLCIMNIETVPLQNPEDALNANLRGKRFIENLMLRWNSSAPSDCAQWQHSRRVMQCLEPSDRLRNLWLVNYPGSSFPRWIGKASFSSLGMVRISNCNNFNFLPLLGQLPQLKYLQINTIPGKAMDTFVGFPSLEHLILLDLPFLERLFLENDIPKLEKVLLSDCPSLKDLVIHQKLHTKIEREKCPNMSVTIHVLQD